MYIAKKLSPLKNSILKKYRLKRYTKKAHGIRQNVIERTGREVVTKKVKEEIKEYSKEMFGTPSFWPWLAVYTEIKGKFIPGWLPNDYFQINILDEWNPRMFSELSDMKTFYHSYYDKFAISPIAVRVSGIYFDEQWNVIPDNKLIDLLRLQSPEVIIKKDSGFAGRDIRFLNTENLKLQTLEEFNGNLVIQPVVQQHKELAKLHNHSLNTLRISTYLDSEGFVKQKFIFLRFGTGGNRLDNAYSGGLLFFLNEKGESISGIINSIGVSVDHENSELSLIISDLKIPSVRKAVEKCKDHHRKFPYVRYIAWDVYIGKDSEPRMIEWNAIRPGMWFSEPHIGPIWDLNSILK